MATDTEFHQSDILSDRQHSQDVSISQILDHGSISFGRFSVETLAWEKRSVFQHNRCQEELEKYKSNGLVAQKKAYFEEYYKKIRALKVLQAEHQETTEPDLCPDGKINALQSENDNCDDLSQVTKSGNETVANLGSVADKPVQLNLSDCNDSTNKVIVTEETSKTLSIEAEHDRIGASLSSTPSVTRSLKSSQPDSPVSDPVKNDANKPKKHASPALKSMGNAALPRNKPKLDRKVTRPRDDVKASEESKPRPPHHSTAKRDNNLLPSKCNTRSSATDNNFNHVSARKQLTEVCSSATVHLASTRSRLVSFSPSGRSHPKRENSNGKNLADTLRTNPPVRSRSVQNPSEQKSVPGGLKNMAIEKRSCTGVSRKPLDLGSDQMRPKVGLTENRDQNQYATEGWLSENQRPKSMFTNKPAKNKSNQNFGADYDRKNCGKERTQKERQLTDFVVKAVADDVIPILVVAFHCQLSQLIDQCIERVAHSDLDSISLEKRLPDEVVEKIKILCRNSQHYCEPNMPIVDPLREKRIRRIHKALDSDDVELMKLLLTESDVTLDEANALHYAAAYCDPKVVTEVLGLGLADVNLRDSRGFTVLHIAVMRKEPSIIILLLSNGARASEPTLEGESIVSICRRLTRPKDYFTKTERGQEANKDRICIDVLEREMLRNPMAGEESISSQMTPNDLHMRLLKLENRVAFARLLFPAEAKLTMAIAHADTTSEFAGISSVKGSSGNLMDVDLNETPTVQNKRLLSRLESLVKTGR